MVSNIKDGIGGVFKGAISLNKSVIIGVINLSADEPGNTYIDPETLQHEMIAENLSPSEKYTVWMNCQPAPKPYRLVIS